MQSPEINEGWDAMVDDVRRACPLPPAQPLERLTTASINAPEVNALLQRLRPDILFVDCVSEKIEPHIYRQPKLGTFIYHEGVTPEYRGVHSIFWALANGDDDKVGYTLLKAEDKLDAGPVYAQGAIKIDPLASPMGYIGHWAQYEGLVDVERVLRDLEQGRDRPLAARSCSNGYYSYFPFSRLRQIRRRRAARGLPWIVTRRSDSHRAVGHGL